MRESDFTRQDLLNLLKKGAPVWNAWRKEHPDRVIDLSYEKLIDLRLAEIDFSLVSLEGCRIQGTDLTNANFRGANLRYVAMYKCIITGADFENSEVAIISLVDTPTANIKNPDALRGALERKSFL